MFNNDNNQQLETGKRKENKTPQKFTGKDIQCCQEGEKVRHLVVSLALDYRQECTATEVGLGRPMGLRGAPACPPFAQDLFFFWGCRSQSGLILHSQSPRG